MTKVLEFPADRIAKGVYHYTPEMGQRKPNCQMKVTIGHYGGYYIRTAVELKGRGIKLVDADNGIHRYKVTDAAYDKLQQQYSISYESNLN